ncbi:hypothetical protein TBLA_0G03430 [Henningerozyma blattae CBS 6284]|uniref:Exonuclease domain-containing protein n=1 Tax=Henningerozyma blattae (strain ATCC 34711 / CBS 6284 / DSM 70876 / NBRC 10599 / NRRL Y-10934 / UCD 77-7) TaxID=1071380 RepID=I2H7C8_HENB6|nr:hypothetical protein TBLA_0G03430 [Tetrapisispora blattae CBS 6284]CCH62280.1 hypothetical protein TBLA_0G03430 [Tetrapisispora blattae CBS 6284]
MSQGISKSITGISKRIRQPLVWVDCEMTGLDHLKDRIMEICCVITDGCSLKPLAIHETTLKMSTKEIDGMGEWCLRQHGASGLTHRCLESTITLEQGQRELTEFIRRWIPQKKMGVLSGNSVHMDRLFLLREYPAFINHLHYRIVDVSSIFEVCRRSNPKLLSQMPEKVKAHTARSDILESILQLQWFEKAYLQVDPEFQKEQEQVNIRDELEKVYQEATLINPFTRSSIAKTEEA